MLFTFGRSIQGNHRLLTYVHSKEKEQKVMVDHLQSGLSPPQMSYDCFLSVEYTRKSAGEERKGSLLNNVCESAFQGTNQTILSWPIFTFSRLFS